MFCFRPCNRLHLKSGMNFLVMVFAIWSKIEKKYKIHDQFSVTSFTVSVKLWHKKSDFSTVFKITLDEMFFMKNHASFWNHHMWEHFHSFCETETLVRCKSIEFTLFVCDSVFFSRDTKSNPYVSIFKNVTGNARRTVYLFRKCHRLRKISRVSCSKIVTGYK